jgi:hypothetical protein
MWSFVPRMAAEIDAVTVLDQLDPDPRGAQVLDQVVVPGAVEDDRRDVVLHPPVRVRDRLDVLGHWAMEVDAPAGSRPDRELPHVHVREPDEGARFPHRDHRHRAVAAARDDPAALEGVEREVDGLAARADRPAGRQLPLDGADDDPPVDRQLLERVVHGRGRGAVGALLVGPAQPPRSRERRALGHARVRLAPAQAFGGLLGLRRGGGDDVGLVRHIRHQTRSNAAACSSTSSITAPIACSMLPFWITGTPLRSASSTMKSWMWRMSAR